VLLVRPLHKLLGIFGGKWVGYTNQEIWATLLRNFGIAREILEKFKQGLVLTVLSIHTKYQLAKRVFSLLKNSFNTSQESAMEDYVY